MDPIRILLIERQALVRTALRLLVASEPGFVVLADTSDYMEASIVAARTQPDVVLLSFRTDDPPVLTLIRELRVAAPAARVLVLIDQDGPRHLTELGVAGVVHLEQDPHVLFNALQRVHAGEIWLGPIVVATTPTAAWSWSAQLPHLTPRECEVIILVAHGLTKPQIAARLAITEITVQHHLGSVYSKLGVGNRMELAMFAYRHNLAPPAG